MISSARFTELLAYEELNPHGEEREDLRSGIVAATIANANRGKNTTPFAPKDFMIDFDRAAKTSATNAGIKHKLQIFTAMCGGKFNG